MKKGMMKKPVSKEIWKIFYAASFLFITIFFILPYLVQISTYFHEKAHQEILDKYGVENFYHLNLIETIPDFFNPQVKKLGVTKFDLDAYMVLNKYEKAEIHVAGIVSDLRFLFLIGIYLTFINLYMLYKVKFKKEINSEWVLAINWLLFMWLLALVKITFANITYFGGDIYQLVKILGV